MTFYFLLLQSNERGRLIFTEMDAMSVYLMDNVAYNLYKEKVLLIDAINIPFTKDNQSNNQSQIMREP